ncbi:MAG: peptide-methionine (R)-S-oxide reductase MsrB [Candidatus Eremiobacteraeota bacterium]|nr:peptide-methionine (R)-S-oxide reductase MsrB [Candidatus Eremiobacteraeota bacterium]
MKRTQFLGALALAGASVAIPRLVRAESYAVAHSDADWRRILGQNRYEILRQNGTEPAFSSSLIQETRKGTYRCAGCDQSVFSSSVKYDSGDGWPSFWTVLPNATRTRSDHDLIETRTEVHCGRCGSHLGHIFDDGPQPTHLRYCIDGLALHFVPARER